MLRPWLTRILTAFVAVLLAAPIAVSPAAAQSRTYQTNELVGTGHQFFGNVSGGLATVIEKAVSQYGQPNGYILGEEGSGAVAAGLRYGEGTLHTRDQGQHRIFWQGPSLGWDIGGEGARTMMLVYNLPAVGAIYNRFGGVDGSAYFIGGFGMTALVNNNVYVVPVRAGVGMRLGVALGYLKFTPTATWNPF